MTSYFAASTESQENLTYRHSQHYDVGKQLQQSKKKEFSNFRRQQLFDRISNQTAIQRQANSEEIDPEVIDQKVEKLMKLESKKMQSLHNGKLSKLLEFGLK